LKASFCLSLDLFLIWLGSTSRYISSSFCYETCKIYRLFAPSRPITSKHSLSHNKGNYSLPGVKISGVRNSRCTLSC